MEIKFKNGSKIETISQIGVTRGQRWNYLQCVCYDIDNDDFIIGTPLINKNHIPKWIIEEIIEKEGV